MRKFLGFLRNTIVVLLVIFGIFISLKGGKKKILVIGTSQRIGSTYYQIASSYNYDLHILTGIQTNKDSSRAIIKNVDGVIFAGGEDFDPALYGSSAYDLVESYSTDQDRSDLELLGLAIEENKPVLGICRGMQLINIYYGGSLYEDLPSQFGRNVSHREGKDNFTYHMVNFLADTLSLFWNSLTPSKRPFVIIIEEDMGKIMGMELKSRLPHVPIIVLDEVRFADGDYIDIGKVQRKASFLPVVIKSLAFPTT